LEGLSADVSDELAGGLEQDAISTTVITRKATTLKRGFIFPPLVLLLIRKTRKKSTILVGWCDHSNSQNGKNTIRPMAGNRRLCSPKGRSPRKCIEETNLLYQQVLEKRGLKIQPKHALQGKTGLLDYSSDTFFKKSIEIGFELMVGYWLSGTLSQREARGFSTSVELLWKSVGNPTRSCGFQ
jgi:hypothetical protein